MRYWDQSDLPFTYSLVQHFPVGERYFCSALGQTYPNRRFLFCGTASGLIATDATTSSTPAANGTIFDRLDAHHIDWAIYYQRRSRAGLIVPGSPRRRGCSASTRSTSSTPTSAAGRLPPSPSSTPTTTPPRRRTRRTSRSASAFIAQVVQRADPRADLEATRRCSSPTTSTAATTTTSRRRGRSSPTRSPPKLAPSRSSRGLTTATASACR